MPESKKEVRAELHDYGYKTTQLKKNLAKLLKEGDELSAGITERGETERTSANKQHLLIYKK
jgi:hypothetical protein